MQYTLGVLFLLVPFAAQADGGVGSVQTYSDVLAAISLWITIIIAAVTTFMVWFGGRSLHGGILGSLLNYFSIGMTLLFIGFLANIPQVVALVWLKDVPIVLVQNVCYTAAYILFGVGISKLLSIIKGE